MSCRVCLVHAITHNNVNTKSFLYCHFVAFYRFLQKIEWTTKNVYLVTLEREYDVLNASHHELITREYIWFENDFHSQVSMLKDYWPQASELTRALKVVGFSNSESNTGYYRPTNNVSGNPDKGKSTKNWFWLKKKLKMKHLTNVISSMMGFITNIRLKPMSSSL